jgi:membrane protein implicated in regulation of membrane protease activity
MLQKRTEDRFRGRVFSTEWLLVMVAESVSIVLASMILELDLLTLRQTVLTFAGLQIVSGLLWIPLVAPRERREAGEGASSREADVAEEMEAAVAE